MSAFGGKADVNRSPAEGPLIAKSGHSDEVFVAHGSSGLADEPGVDYRVRGALGADGEDAALAVQPEGLAQGRGPGGGNGGQYGDGGFPLNPFKSA